MARGDIRKCLAAAAVVIAPVASWVYRGTLAEAFLPECNSLTYACWQEDKIPFIRIGELKIYYWKD